MAQYISKDALVAVIKNLENFYKRCPTHTSYEEGLKEGRLIGYKDALNKINAFEVKEVDLKQSYREYINNTYTEEFAKSILNYNIKGDLDTSDLFGIMSYGFELGLKAQKGE